MGPWTVGIDVGVRMTRALVLDGAGAVRSRVSVPSGAFFTKAAEEAYAEALAGAGIAPRDVAYVTSTGYGRYQVPFRDLKVTEMTCHGVGALAVFPGTRTVLDIGAQNTRVVGINPQGRVERFKMNDKCAAGAGRFIERVSAALEVPLAEIGPLALQSHDPQPISSVCAVLAESEVINLVSQDFRTEDILLGIHMSICERINALVQQAGLEADLTLTGGMVNNPAMVRVLERGLNRTVNVSPEGEYAGALGAAIVGRRRHDRRAADPSGAARAASAPASGSIAWNGGSR
jgi:(R)-2-hydroxyacyl-CoA dehydratese activating ATPase